MTGSSGSGWMPNSKKRDEQKKRPLRVRLRAFRIWQELGYFPWRKEKKARKQRKRDFYKGAFNDIPFLNDDAKRTFTHLLLRPGYMIRDYMSGQQKREDPFEDMEITFRNAEASVAEYIIEKGETTDEQEPTILLKTYQLLHKGYLYLHLDEFPEEVDTRHGFRLRPLPAQLFHALRAAAELRQADIRQHPHRLDRLPVVTVAPARLIPPWRP